MTDLQTFVTDLEWRRLRRRVRMSRARALLWNAGASVIIAVLKLAAFAPKLRTLSAS